SPFPANPSVRRLIVTEKFNAAVRIATILSDGKAKRTNVEGTSVFEFSQGEDRVRVVGLRGHIINLDYPEALNDWARVDLKELVWAEPQKVVTAGKIGAALKQLAADADEVIIATDFDREGGSIGAGSRARPSPSSWIGSGRSRISSRRIIGPSMRGSARMPTAPRRSSKRITSTGLFGRTRRRRPPSSWPSVRRKDSSASTFKTSEKSVRPRRSIRRCSSPRPTASVLARLMR